MKFARDLAQSLAIAAGIIAAILITPTIVPRFNDEPTDPQAQRANQRAIAEARCANLYGREAIFFETKGGHLVCRKQP